MILNDLFVQQFCWRRKYTKIKFTLVARIQQQQQQSNNTTTIQQKHKSNNNKLFPKEFSSNVKRENLVLTCQSLKEIIFIGFMHEAAAPLFPPFPCSKGWLRSWKFIISVLRWKNREIHLFLFKSFLTISWQSSY